MRQNHPNQAPRRKLIPNLLSSILNVVAESDQPLTQHEICVAVSQRLDRYDEELKRQITVNLHDALIYGYLRVKDFRYSIVPNRWNPNEAREQINSGHLPQHQVDERGEPEMRLRRNTHHNTITASTGGNKRQAELQSTTQQS